MKFIMCSPRKKAEIWAKETINQFHKSISFGTIPIENYVRTQRPIVVEHREVMVNFFELLN